MTLIPTWQFREHSVQPIHLSFAVILNLPNHVEYNPINFASGHQYRHQTFPPKNGYNVTGRIPTSQTSIKIL